MQVAEQVAGRVAHLAVHIGQLFHDSWAQGHIGGVIHRTHPQPQYVGAVGGILFLVFAALHQHGRIHHVAQRFAHLAALLIEGEAVGEHPPVGGVAVDGHRGEQAALEPATVLVAALQIEVGRVAQAPLLQHPGPGGAGIKPHVHGVGALAPLRRLGGMDRWQQAGLIALPPHIGAVLGDQALDVAEGGPVEQHLAGFAVVEDGDRHTPGALAADAPVAPLAHHGLDPVAAAGRQPLHLGDRLQGGAAEALHRGKPLLGGPEDGGLFGAPVVGVAVLVALLQQQGAGGLQGLDDRRIGVLEHVGAGKGAGFGGEVAGLVHRAEHRQAVFFAGVEVVYAMAGGGVHQARAGFGGDVVAADHHSTGAIQQGMAVDDALELGALEAAQRRQLDAQLDGEAFAQLGGHHQVAITAAADGVVEVGVHRHRQVGGQGPGGGGPDRHRQVGGRLAQLAG